MKTNANLQYNQDVAELTLDKLAVESEPKTDPSDIQDESDLVKAEKSQKEEVFRGTQVISSPRGMRELRKDDRFIVLGSIAAGVFSVIAVYMYLVLT